MSKILIVDDDEPILELMRLALEGAELEVVCAMHPFKALELLDQMTFDLLVTDLLMPDLDGIKLIDRAFRTNPDIEVLAVSGGGADVDGNDLLDQALSCGAAAILEKPFTPGELVRTVKALLR